MTPPPLPDPPQQRPQGHHPKTPTPPSSEETHLPPSTITRLTLPKANPSLIPTAKTSLRPPAVSPDGAIRRAPAVVRLCEGKKDALAQAFAARGLAALERERALLHLATELLWYAPTNAVEELVAAVLLDRPDLDPERRREAAPNQEGEGGEKCKGEGARVRGRRAGAAPPLPPLPSQVGFGGKSRLATADGGGGGGANPSAQPDDGSVATAGFQSKLSWADLVRRHKALVDDSRAFEKSMAEDGSDTLEPLSWSLMTDPAVSVKSGSGDVNRGDEAGVNDREVESDIGETVQGEAG